MKLEKQVHIYSVDTSAFYYKDENKIHNRLKRLYIIKNEIKKQRKNIYKQYKSGNKLCENDKVNIDNKYKKINKILHKHKRILYAKLKSNSGGVRELNEKHIVNKNIVSIFNSDLIRTTNMKINEVSKNLIIVQTYFFEILEDITLNGFTYKSDKYIVYTASAGQIRTKKTLFIKENVLKEHENTLTCGLTNEIINQKGGINVNKYLAYKSLQNSATEEWTGFNIDKTIVVNDFETNIKTLVDDINDVTYEITRVEKEVPIPHTDGCGMMLPSFCNNSRMCRLPWIKGLLVPFDFRLFVTESIDRGLIKNAIIKDIYGKEHDIIKDDIQIIFTESQFKMHKFYIDWNEYKKNFKKYNCHAGYCNDEQDNIKNAKINYQMLQTLTDITDKELKKISERTIDNIKKIATDKKTMMKLLGVTKENTNKNHLQQAIQYYPPLLNDTYSKEILKQVRKSLVKKAKSAKLLVDAKYTFICPDLYAFCEWLFLGNKNPKGLLRYDEVSCSLYEDGKELDCLRSPHLYLEHCVRNNKVTEQQKKWFITKGLYTSCRDVITKILQNDCDGDMSLVCADENIVKIAKRNIEKNDIVPLYYNMKKANATVLDNKTLYDGMTSAYKGGNIGSISNDITKIWNSENVDLDAIKLLCMENNFVIDYAKTLYKPVRPKWAKEKITKHVRNKTPHFFIYAKDKKTEDVSPINNSVVNRLNKIIKNPRIKIHDIKSNFNYKKLMHNPKFKLGQNDLLIVNKYNDLDLKNVFIIDRGDDGIGNSLYIYQDIRKQILDINKDEKYVTDVLIAYLYTKKIQNKKVMLWECFGDVIVDNLRNNIISGFKNSAIECAECGILIEKKSNVIKCCNECSKEIEKQNWSERKRKQRKQAKCHEIENR